MGGFDALRAANIARDTEWNTGAERVSLAFRGNELAGETGEACNVLKKLERERIGIVGSRATPEQLAEELADVVICADLIAMHVGVDLGDAIASKFNATSEKYGLATRMDERGTMSALEAEHDRRVTELLTHNNDLLEQLRAARRVPGNAVVVEIAAERQRQIFVEGFAPDNDDAYVSSQLTVAAACCALPPRHITMVEYSDGSRVPKFWPWLARWWKPKDRRRDLVRAAALIVAEIERLDRAEAAHG